MAGPGAKILLLAAGLAAFSASGATAQPAQAMPERTGPVPLDAPSVQIRNGRIAAKIYRIDSEKGFYIDIALPPGATKHWVYTYRYNGPAR